VSRFLYSNYRTGFIFKVFIANNGGFEMKYIRNYKHALLLFALFVLTGFSLPLYAATITVDTVDDEFDFFAPNDQCSLREAISAANSDGPVDSCASGSGDDVIIFDESLEGATIVLDLEGAGEDDNVTGDLDVDGPGSLEIRGTSAVIRPLELPDPIIIDGNGTDRVFDVFSDLTLFNVGIFNGGGVATGGGIRTDTGATLILDAVIINENSLEAPFSGAFISGAGVYAAGPMSMLLTLISNNTASGDAVNSSGGGIKYVGIGTTLTIVFSQISDNMTSSTAGGLVAGGGIDVISSADVEIARTQIINNVAEIMSGRVDSNVFGGAINFQSSGTLSITETVIRGNTAEIQGDGDEVLGGGISFMQGEIDHSEISNNMASSDNALTHGGGIHSSGMLEITNTTVSNNTAITMSSDVNGGGLYANGAADVVLNNTTIAGNSSISDSGTTSGGGIENDGGSVSLSNSILALNSAGMGTDCMGTITSGDFNLIGNASDCGFSPMSDDQVNTDPMLGPLADNGGVTQTMVLLDGSPAIDAADPADPSGAGTCEIDDQRGEMRPFDGNDDGMAVCDIGAFELQEIAMPPETGGTGGTSGGSSSSGCFLTASTASGSTIVLSVFYLIPLFIFIRRLQRKMKIETSFF